MYLGPLLPILKTGQTTSYADYDDGYYEKGYSLGTRFVDNSNGTVTDLATDLIWLKNAHLWYGSGDWFSVLTACYNVKSGSNGLSDGSTQGMWRLASLPEVCTLLGSNVTAFGIYPGGNTSTTYVAMSNRNYKINFSTWVITASNKTITNVGGTIVRGKG